METAAHSQLKRFAIGFLRHHGCQALATEVACPLSRWRVDVAGYLDTRPEEVVRASGPLSLREWVGVRVDGTDAASRPDSDSGDSSALGAKPQAAATALNDDTKLQRRRLIRCEPRTILIECKQSRGDFLRDRTELERLLAERDRLQAVRVHLEENRIKACEPHLRQSGSALFQELETWDFAASKLNAYRKVLRELRLIEKHLYGQTKFCMIARYCLADRLYLAAPAGMLKPRELPEGWGLLECPRKWLRSPPSLFDLVGEPALRVAVIAPEQRSPRKFQLRLLRNIAVAATWASLTSATS